MLHPICEHAHQIADFAAVNFTNATYHHKPSTMRIMSKEVGSEHPP
jgi:hypothetical protein